jgi:hypothetical protein
MATTYKTHQYDEVIPIYDGRVSNSTTDWRPLTDYEKQLLGEIEELKKEIETLKTNEPD